MTCEETQHRLNAYVDSELELSLKLAIESHLQECFSCSSVLESLVSLVYFMQKEAPRFKAPEHLKRIVTAPVPPARPGVVNPFTRWIWIGSAAAVVLIAALFGVMSTRTSPPSFAEARLLDEVVSSHVRSMMASHLTDIASSDTHNVKPWFAGKLDYSPPAKDLTVQGFPLVGGRMDYLADRPVAALVYRRNQHLVNLFVWPASQSSSLPETRSAVRGYNLIHWSESGLTYWLISDLSPTELGECARLLRE